MFCKIGELLKISQNSGEHKRQIRSVFESNWKPTRELKQIYKLMSGFKVEIKSRCDSSGSGNVIMKYRRCFKCIREQALSYKACNCIHVSSHMPEPEIF